MLIMPKESTELVIWYTCHPSATASMLSPRLEAALETM